MRDKNFEIETKLLLLHFYDQTCFGQSNSHCYTDQCASACPDLEHDGLLEDDAHDADDADSTDSSCGPDEDVDKFQHEVRHTMETLQLENKDLEPTLSPISDTAKSLRIIADKFQADYEQKIDQSIFKLPIENLTYDMFKNTFDNIWEPLPAPERTNLKMISALMVFSKRCALHYWNEGTGFKQIVDYTTEYMGDVAADYIVGNGGWRNLSQFT